MAKRIGNRTVEFEKNIFVVSFSSAVGPKEADGPLSQYFDNTFNDEFLGQKSFEKAESKLQQISVETTLKKSSVSCNDIDVIFAGDLLNQCIGSAYGLRKFEIPFVGLYGACSTMAVSIISASNAIESGLANNAIAVTSSHFCSSERQFRFPLEYGGQRPQTSQWTVTGSGSVLLSTRPNGVQIKHATIGKIIDLKVTDLNNMGAAMAPAAADTISMYLYDTKTSPSDYDLILTGDLGYTGSDLFLQLMKNRNITLPNHNDCGMMIFDRKRQDVHSGGSGCGCSASVLCSIILKKLQAGLLQNVLFCATGALMSPTSSMQGESIPSIAHLVHFTNQN